MNEAARPDPTSPESHQPIKPALYDSRDIADPPAWPKTIGWISAIWGVVGLGCLGLGVLGAMMPVIFAEGMAQQFPDGFPDVIASPAMSAYIMWALSGLSSVFLILAGSMLIMRRRVAWHLHIAYAVIGTLLAGVGVWMGVEQQQAVTDWVNQNPQTKFAEQQKAGGTFNTVIMIVFILIGFAWPVFCGLWFGLLKRDPAEIDRGKAAVV